jgi:uncharacterized protein involved in type VI secretion and phage assembly
METSYTEIVKGTTYGSQYVPGGLGADYTEWKITVQYDENGPYETEVSFVRYLTEDEYQNFKNSPIFKNS